MTIYNSGKPKNKPSPIEVLLFGYVKNLPLESLEMG